MSSLSIEEKFQVKAPADTVFEFLTNPEKVVVCLPGAGLDEIENPTTFHGNVKVKVGAVTVGYKGTINLTERDPASRKVTMVGEGREKGGAGSAKMTMHSVVLDNDGVSEVTVNADVVLAGKIVRFGRGMIDAVAAQVFKDFVANVRSELEPTAVEVPEGATPEEVAAASASAHAVVREQKPINGLALVFKVIATAIANFFKRIFGSGDRQAG